MDCPTVEVKIQWQAIVDGVCSLTPPMKCKTNLDQNEGFTEPHTF
jgi:hypothetical protein